MKGTVPGAVKTKGVSVAPVKAAKIIGVFFIVIHFLIFVGIMKDRNLAPIEDEDSFFIDMDAHRLIEPGGIALPGDFGEVVLDMEEES